MFLPVRALTITVAIVDQFAARTFQQRIVLAAGVASYETVQCLDIDLGICLSVTHTFKKLSFRMIATTSLA